MLTLGRKHAADVARRLHAMVRRLRPLGKTLPLLLKVAVVVTLFLSAAVSAGALWALYSLPMDRRSGSDDRSVMIEAANGEPVGRVGRFADYVGREQYPEILVKAVLSIEDRRFYSHWGIDPWGIIRALVANWSAGDIVEGGSTITQQLAKLELVGRERTLDRKIREAFVAGWLDFQLGKEEILTRYLNSVYMGSGAQGMSAAARVYFDKRLAELTLPEAAMLAGLVQAPSRYNPIRNLGAARRRAAVVIDAMLENGAIDAKAAEKAKAEPAKLNLSSKAAPAGSWFADWIARHELPKIVGSMRRPMRVATTLEPKLQQLAERIVRDTLAQDGEARGIGQAALVAMRPDGSVVAMVGGRDYGASQFNRAVDAMRQPGSAFKLFVYYAALRNGYAPNDIIDASPVEVGRWRPENYDGAEYGYMTLSEAFARSVNSAAIRLGMTVGLDEVVAAARELGLNAPLIKVPSMALGTNEVSLLDLTGAFASVRAGHPKLEPWGISAFGAEGTALRSLGAPRASNEDLPRRHDLTRLLQEAVDYGTGHAAALDDDVVGGKTGTSQDYRDAWFVGFSSSLVVGVWVGNDDRTSMKRVTGGSLPAQIWQRFVSEGTLLLPRLDEPPTPQVATFPAASAQCDQSACGAAYGSFRASDCTYQPYDGPRRFCEQGSQSFSRVSAALTSGFCDVDRCSRRYRSFDPLTCTYQPYEDGPRRICGSAWE